MLTFHYRDTPNELRSELIEKARSMIESFGFIATESQCALEAKPPVQWNKGKNKMKRIPFGDEKKKTKESIKRKARKNDSI